MERKAQTSITTTGRGLSIEATDQRDQCSRILETVGSCQRLKLTDRRHEKVGPEARLHPSCGRLVRPVAGDVPAEDPLTQVDCSHQLGKAGVAKERIAQIA